MKLIKDQHVDILDLENKSINRDDFRNYDAKTMDILPVMYQSGYLTIGDYDTDARVFTLDYPNEEVKSSVIRNWRLTKFSFCDKT
ncbi:hypothetical protein FACS1894106_3260 [Spirochaetia bacterium]|nr:hypothetical protein FACS1894106_3260 [Spirochaetia bacterium]